MSKILVLGRTMDMGGTEVAMAALLQRRSAGADSEGSGSAPDDLE